MYNQFHHYASTRLRRRFPKSFTLRRSSPATTPKWYHQIHDPGSKFVLQWNYMLFISSSIALFIDPLYFYLPMIGVEGCTAVDMGMGAVITMFRTLTDLLYGFHIFLQFRTAFVKPDSRVFGRGELVKDPKEIAKRYLSTNFIIDLSAALPLPQFVIWGVIAASNGSSARSVNHTLSLIVLVQYIPRFYQMRKINRRIVKSTGTIARTAWSGAAYNLVLYMLISHILGASWYVLSVRQLSDCWRIECQKEGSGNSTVPCRFNYLDCNNVVNLDREEWFRTTTVFLKCDPRNTTNEFKFGIFSDALTSKVVQTRFINKYFYCLWWGLRNLSSYGQNLITTTSSGQTLLCSFICILGLVFFSHLIGNMQTYLQSIVTRLEEWRIRRRDTEEWMRHRQLPLDLQERVRRIVQYRWRATRGVDEESILRELPLDLRRQIQRHLCLALVRRVHFFAQMDDQLLDAICERLVPSLNTRDTYLTREGDPVQEMLFVIRGELESSTTNGGRSGFYNSITLKAGDFCGEELLTWALVPSSSLNLPTSTRTVKSLTEVEAFALRAEDLKFVASQFKRLHSKKLQHAFRYYSHQWRTWGACYIQVAWRRYVKNKQTRELVEQESFDHRDALDPENNYPDETTDPNRRSLEDNTNNAQHLKATVLASQFAANTRRGAQQQKDTAPDSTTKMPKLFKPQDPDFSTN